MNRLRWLTTILFLISINIYSQPGRLLLVGGGAEKNGVASWSTPAYRWAGEGRKVAIIGISTGSLAPYFIQQCGALYAKEFAIDSFDSANSQATYDTLTAYDVIFFRGGDQWKYYDFYKNTKLLDAVNHIYSQGGTICGTSAGLHILSSVVFTAQFGSAYPDECIENPNNQYVTLENDFLNLLPGIIFDSHFAERGRFGRLLGFLANYKLNNGIDISGIGLDDMTCMTIDENGIGTVLGTGCANIYSAGCNYSLNGTKLLADTIDIKQLLQGCTYNFNTHEATFNTLNRQINTASLEETGNYTVLASGSNSLPDNMAMLNELVTGNGLSSDPVLLLSGNETQANAFKEKLLLFGSSGVEIFMINADAGANPELSQKIDSAVKILFLLNSTTTFNPFLSSQNGEFLKQKVHNSGMITAFVGDDARFAGNTVVENYLTLYASYYGELTFSKGLSLLRHTVIMPNTYQNSDVYENTITAVPYAMALDSLKYGIWLTNHSYMKYTPAEEKAMLTGYGSAPVMVIRNEGSLAGFSSHTSNGNNSTAPRMIAGYEHLQLSLIDYTTPYFMGNVQTAGVQNESGGMTDFIQPNPVKDMLFLHGDFHDFGWEIINVNGKRIMQGKSIGKQEQINVSILRSGIYLLRLTNKKSNSILNAKFIKM